MAKKKVTKTVKTLTLRIEEEIVNGNINQDIIFDTQNLSRIEALGLLRLYEQQTSIELIYNPNLTESHSKL